MSIIGLGVLSKQLLYLCVIPILSIIQLFITKEQELSYNFLRLFCHFLGILIFGLVDIFMLCFQCNIRKQSKIEAQINQQLQFTAVSSKSVQIKKAFLTLFIITKSIVNCILCYIMFYLQTLPVRSLHVLNQILQSIFLVILCHYYLHYKYYQHHFVSLGIVLIGLILILIIAFQEEINYYAYLMYAFLYLLMAPFEVIDKWLMEVKGINPFRLLLIEGISGLITTLIIALIGSGIKCEGVLLNLDNFCIPSKPIDSFDSFKMIGDNLFYYISSILAIGLMMLSTKMINFYYTPIHRKISDLTITFIIWIRLYYSVAYKIILIVIGFIIIIFGGLVYNELIIIYKWSLEWNTKKEITKRSEDNFLIALTNDMSFEEKDNRIHTSPFII